MPGSQYSVKWKGWITAPYSGNWTLYETSDDAIGVYLDGAPVLQDWSAHAPREKSAAVFLTGGQPRYLEIYHINYGGGAVAKLEWSHPMVPRQVVPQTWLTTSTPSFPTLSAVEIWRFGSFGTTSNADTAANEADPDGDGFPNSLEFVLGGNPVQPNRDIAPVVSSSHGNLVLTFRRADVSESPDVTVTIEVGNDLASWHGSYPVHPGLSVPGVSIEENGSAPDLVTISIPQDGQPAGFARLKVSLDP
jgi:hypothetical protein